MHRQDWEAAERILTQNDSKYEDTVWKRHMLSEVYFAKGEYEIAIECCRKAREDISDKYREPNRKPMSYYMSIDLLAEIMEKRAAGEADKDDSRHLKRMLRANFKGVSLTFKYSLM